MVRFCHLFLTFSAFLLITFRNIITKCRRTVIQGVIGLTNPTSNTIHPKPEEPAMLEKFVQAAIITFLLHLTAGLSLNTPVQTKTAPSEYATPTPIARALLRVQ